MGYHEYYKIPDLDKNASKGDIKKFYRKLAVKYHQYKNPGNTHAEEKFKEITEINKELSDPEKRKKYYLLGANRRQYEQAGFNPSYFFKTFFRRSAGNASSFRRFHTDIPHIDLAGDLNISLQESYSGTNRIIDLEKEKRRGKIKSGVFEGMKLKVKGKGQPGKSGKPGDLYLSLHVQPHNICKRKDDYLYMDLPVDLFTLMLCGKVQVITLSGPLNITLPEGTPNGKQLRLRSKGMPVYGKSSHHDLYKTLKDQLATSLNIEQKKLIKKLQNNIYKNKTENVI